MKFTLTVITSLLVVATTVGHRLGEPVERKLANTLTYYGQNPYGDMPLGRCEGDCDSDSECQSGLRCFFRGGYEAVPGCGGSGSSQDIEGKDYCYDPDDSVDPSSDFECGGPLTLVANNESPPSVFPLGCCQGDCDSDDDCAGYLECFFRKPSSNSGAEVPGCTGTGGPGNENRDYCYDPANVGPEPFCGNKQLTYLGREPSDWGKAKLGCCEGDCDAYSDGTGPECEDGLLCFLRSGTQPVPGCSGSGISGRDYCYHPDDA